MKKYLAVFSLGLGAGFVLGATYMKGYVHDFAGALNRKIDSMFD
jgi:hypothetical protein